MLNCMTGLGTLNLTMAMNSKDMSSEVVFHVGSVWAVWAGKGLLASVDAHVAAEALLAGATTE